MGPGVWVKLHYFLSLLRPRGRPRVDAFESTRKDAVQPLTGGPPSDAACVNMQNIREFNQLKYRGNDYWSDHPKRKNSQFSVWSVCLKHALDCRIMSLPVPVQSFPMTQRLTSSHDCKKRPYNVFTNCNWDFSRWLNLCVSETSLT